MTKMSASVAHVIYRGLYNLRPIQSPRDVLKL